MTFPKVKNELDVCTDDMQLLPSARAFFAEFEKKCEAAGIFLKTKETMRFLKRQEKLHKDKPASSAIPGKSMHGERIAKDYCINSKADAYNTHLLTKAGRIWESMGGTWGGDWKMVDMPHFQIVALEDQDKVRAFKQNWDKLDAYIKSYILKARKK